MGTEGEQATAVSKPVERDDAYTIRSAEPDDEDGFLSLYESIWGTRKDDEWYQWRFESDYADVAARMVVAEYDDEIVGAEACLPFPLAVGSEVVTALQPVDWLVHDDHRRKGLFSDMTRHCLARDTDADLYFNFPTEVLVPGLEKFDWQIVDELTVYRRLQRPSAVADTLDERRLTSVLGRCADPLASGHQLLCQFRADPPESIVVRRFDSVPAATLASLYERTSGLLIHTHRDEAFYRWRFANPRWDVSTYVAVRNGEPVASITVCAEVLDELTKLFVADVLPAGYRNPKPKEALAALLEAIIEDYRDADIISAFGASLPTDVLEACGFLANDELPLRPVTKSVRLAVRPLSSGTDADWVLNGVNLTDPAQWALSIGTKDIA